MMRITSKQVNNPLVLNGVNYLIVKHDQVPFVHIKIGILFQSRRNTFDKFNVWYAGCHCELHQTILSKGR